MSRLPAATAAERVELLRVMGNACRELRQVDESDPPSRARPSTRPSSSTIPSWKACASMSLAASLSYSGEFERSLELATRAVSPPRRRRQGRRDEPAGRPAAAGGPNPEALEAFTAALDAAAGTSDRTHRRRHLDESWVLLGWAGEIEAAEADTRRALDLYESQGWTKRAADMRHNLAWLAARRGDLVESFRRFDEAEQRYESLGVSGAAVFPDRAEALLAAGLPQEALTLAERAVQGLRAQGDDVDVAEALMLVARAALLAGDVDRAAAAAGEAMDAVRGPGPRRLVGGCSVAAGRSPSTAPEGRSNPTPPSSTPSSPPPRTPGSPPLPPTPGPRRRAGRRAR